MRGYGIVLALLLCFSFVACGGGNSATNTGTNSTGGNTGGSNTGGSNSGGSNNGGGNGGGTGGTVAADAIGGKVVDATSQAVPTGTVVVALETQQGDARIVNATTPDAQGNFLFTHVAAGDYAIVVSAAVDRNTSYTPMLLVSGSKTISPGTYVGTISVPRPAANSWTTVNVPVQSDKPITVTMGVDAFVNDNMYPIPWALDVPTFDTSVQASCPNSGGACVTQPVQLPANPVSVASFNGTMPQFAASSAGYYFTVNAYSQNGGTQNCNPNALGPLPVSSSPSPFVFSNCQ